MRNGMNEKQTVVGFLESAGAAAMESRRLQRRVESLTEQQSKLLSRKGAAARKLTRLIDTERTRELALMEQELESYRAVEKFLAKIPDGAHRTILRRRYLDVGLSWTEIRDRLAQDGLYYSQRHIIRLHTQAVEAASELWNTVGEEGARKKRR